jgi:hypothetical protein
MATYKVYIARPATQPPVWDWSDTIVRSTAKEALDDSYQKWVDSHPNPAPPPLAQCRTKVTQSQSVEIEIEVLNV